MENQKLHHEKKGYWLACGFTRKLAEILIIGFLFVAIYNGARYVFEWGKDDTDPSGKGRSGLTLYTDHGTGVQYLSDGKGGLTPRLSSDGQLVTSSR